MKDEQKVCATGVATNQQINNSASTAPKKERGKEKEERKIKKYKKIPTPAGFEPALPKEMP